MNGKLITALIAAAVTCNFAADAKSYNAFKDFSSTNPSGAWTYGSGTTGSTFAAYPDYTTNAIGLVDFNIWSGANMLPYVGANQSGVTYVSKTALIPKSTMVMHPGSSSDSILEWTAPKRGTYAFSGFYEILDESPTGIAALIFDNTANITTTAFHGGSGVLTGPGANLNTLKPGGKEKFSFSLTVVEGEVVSFGVNNDGNYDFDTTGVSVSVKRVGQGR